MDSLKLVQILAAGLMLSGCADTLDSPAGSPGQGIYGNSGNYGVPAYQAPGYYGQPGYAAPYSYPYQPTYAAPYGYAPGWSGDRDHWRDHEWRDHAEHAYQNDHWQAPPASRPEGRQASPVAVQPRSLAPPAPPPAPQSQAAHNQKQLDQLGFRPNR